MKKNVLIICLSVLAFLLLIPIPTQYKDGGTVKYKSVLYSIYHVHRLSPLDEIKNGKKFYEGFIIEVLGTEVFNNVK